MSGQVFQCSSGFDRVTSDGLAVSRLSPKEFPAGDGELAALIRKTDWASTPLGPVGAWSPTLKGALSLALPASAQIVMFWGPQYVALYNDAYAPTIGSKHPHALGQPAAAYWSELWDDLEPLLRRARGGETVVAKDRPFQINRHGYLETVYFDISYSPARGDDGTVEGVVCIVSETTTRVQAERRLQFLDALGRDVAHHIDPDKILAITTRRVGEHLGVTNCAYADMDEDQDGFAIRDDWAAPGKTHLAGRYRLTDFGRLAVQNLGAGKPLVINDNLKELPPEESTAFQSIGVTATVCMPLVKQGRLTALMAVHRATPHVWTDDELALVREVTERSWAHIERARSEAEVRAAELRFREELEREVAERTNKLMRAEQALRQAQKLEAIGNLTGGIAHDFNNLLMAVLGNLELLRKRMPADAGLLRLLDGAAEGARRGSGLTSRMLAFARRQELKAERIKLDRLVAGMADLMERSLGSTMMVDIAISPALPAVDIDPNQLETALLNLVVNARDAMQGAGTVMIGAREERLAQGDGALAAGHYVCLTVTDSGEGMDAETLKHAAEPFFTTKGVGKGTGLGLSMVHGLANQSGGALRLHSTPGQGTTAEIWLPVATGEVAASPVAEPGAPLGASHLKSLTILVVDDDALIRMSMVDMLEDLGHVVREAGSASEALAQLDTTPFDLLMTDHAMPHMTGSQLAERARALAPAMPIILATGYADLPSGTTLVLPRLPKPFTQADLAAIIAQVMQG